MTSLRYWLFLHHKCASQYLRAQIAKAGVEAGVLTGMSAFNSLREPPGVAEVGHAMAVGDYTLDDNAWPDLVTTVDVLRGSDWRGIHCYRDPRDLLVSAYFSHRYSHPTHSLPGLEAHRAALEELDEETGLLAELDFYLTDQAIRAIVQWPYDHTQVISVDAIAVAGALAEGDQARFRACMTWLDIPVPDAFDPPRYETLSSRARGTEDNTHHYRHGVQGDWQRYFTPRVLETFERRHGTWTPPPWRLA
jgi:hypothetical protein